MRIMKIVCITVAFLVSALFATPVWAGGGVNCGFGSFEGAENTVRLFPTYAVIDPDKKVVVVPVHVWVYEREQDRLRRYAVKAFAKQLDIEEGTPKYTTFQRRMTDFMVDNESGEKVSVRIRGEGIEDSVRSIGETPGNGHVFATIEVPLESKKKVPDTISISVRTGEEPFQSETIEIPVVSATGSTVVSDIDDTIKITNVLDKKELLANSFTREFRAVPNMAKLFAGWEKQGAAFHYLSASPWNLQSDLAAFVKENNFPDGVYHLRVLRLKDVQESAAFLKSSRPHKLSELTTLLKRFPKRKFILVGDTGEHDPEIYGEIARKFPDQIEQIHVRKVEGADHSKERFEKAFKGVDAKKWTAFDSSAL